LFRENMRVLDVGCKRGSLAGLLHKNLRHFRYTGLDSNPKAISAAKKSYPQHDFLVVRRGDFGPIEKKKFDLVAMLGVVSIYDKWKETVQLAWRCSKKYLVVDSSDVHIKTENDKMSSFLLIRRKRDSQLSKPQKETSPLPYIFLDSAGALQSVIKICTPYKKFTRYIQYTNLSSSAEQFKRYCEIHNLSLSNHRFEEIVFVRTYLVVEKN